MAYFLNSDFRNNEFELEPVFTKWDKRDKIGTMKKENRKSYPSDLGPVNTK